MFYTFYKQFSKVNLCLKYELSYCSRGHKIFSITEYNRKRYRHLAVTKFNCKVKVNL